ncbi:D-alanyl-D-alanine carboxypeptidase [Candidatus Cyanaurora vandensis]|uniref:D-alanyl-D-alanine carboxypeptidase n=1 Tax=Candidatus Cyanaurora vandensis TaxID=2714958 RepID=UPI00257DE2F4|nr:D-alanyl-D-alanine carboxypeptidase [Candidatus Cyanaurora vandensis]
MWARCGAGLLLLVLASVPVQAGPLWEQLQAKFKQHRINPALQGVLILDAEGNIIESHQATAPLPAASITKLATTLAVLDYWGPDHQFMTRLYAGGPVVAGVLQGNLYVQGGADPLFLWEDAFRLGQQLQQLGIQRVQGDLVVIGPFWMNFTTDSLVSTRNLRLALNSRQWSATLRKRYQGQATASQPPTVTVAGVRRMETLPLLGEPTVVYPSLPLWKIAKRMNSYSTNPLAQMLGAVAGGPGLMNQRLQAAYQLAPQGLQLRVASGLGRENKISPQAVAALIGGLTNRMQQSGRTLADVMAVKGADPGTLEQRMMPLGVVAKTGTLNGVSCLAGVIETNQGPLRFVLLNQGPVSLLRKIQDWFLQGVQQRYGKPESTPFISDGFVDQRVMVAPAQTEILSGSTGLLAP